MDQLVPDLKQAVELFGIYSLNLYIVLRNVVGSKAGQGLGEGSWCH